jgi:hypothetical protein
MSANLLDGATATRGTKDSDGYWVLSQNNGTDKQDTPMWRIDGQPTLEGNQTIHMACSVMPDEDWASNACTMSIEYADAAGHLNWAAHIMGAAKAGVWTRLETSVIVPSGMRVTRAVLTNAHSKAAGAKVTGVMVSYGSPVTLASSAHTPYATQDHLQTNYATNSALEQTSTEIQASVSDSLTQAKTYTDGQVETEVTNRNAAITESANEIKSEVSETYATQDSLAAANSAITQNANAISSEVTARKTTDSNVSTLSTKVTQNADNITTEISDRESAVSAVDTKATTAQSTADAAKSAAATAQSTADTAKAAASANTTDLTNYIESNDSALSQMQSQIDGSITTWFYDVAPTADNSPAKDWTTTDLKNNHLGDLYYDTVTGYCYRYQVANNTYSWSRITDTDVTKALSDAAAAQDAADSKRRIFVNTPTPPYDVGDQWAQGTSGDILICSTAKASGQSYAASDWTKASKYTDDTAAAAAQTTADAAKSAAADNASEIASIKTDYVTNSTFDQSNTEIKASVADTLTQAKTYTDGQVETEVTNRNAAITESASEIKSEVSETYATQETVNSISVGGRNLLRNSEDELSSAYPSSGYIDLASWYRAPSFTTKYLVTTDATDTEYVLSFDAKSTVSGDHIHCYFYPSTTTSATSSAGVSSNATDGNISVYLSDSYTRYWIKYTQTTGTASKNVIAARLFAGEGTGTVSIKNVKFESGNKPTDWSPAPEDLATAAQMTSANSAITQNANAISSEVTARKTTDSNVSTLSTKVTQNADNITTEISERKDAISDLQSASLSTVAVYYALGDSASTAPTSGWSTTAPTWVSGKYMWQKTTTTKADGTSTDSDPTCISGATGATGSAGKGISSTAITYQVGSSATTAPTGTWNSTVQATTTDNPYLWTRTITTYSDGSTSTSYSVGAKGDTGDQGDTGVGVSSVTPYYYLSSSSTTQTGGSWSTTCPAWKTGYYYWTKNRVVYSDGSTADTAPVLDQASNTANQTANTANTTATTLSTLIRESSSGVDVGKSSDGSAYSTSVARVGSDGAFHILTSALVEVAKYAGALIELGKNSTSAVIKFCGGLGEMGLLTDAETTFSPSFGLHSDAKPITLLYSHTVSDSDFESGSHTAGSFPTGTKIDSSVAAGQANDYGGGEAAIMSSAVAPDGKHRAWGSVGLLSGFSDSTGTANPSTDAPHMFVRGGTSDGSTTSYFGGEYPLENLAHVLSETVLYNGGAALNYNTAPGAGTKGTVTLSESAANFSKLKIFYRTDDTAYQSVEIPAPNGKQVELSVNHPWGFGQATGVLLKGASVTISGTSITVGGYCNIGITTSAVTSFSGNVIYIVRVEGIR